MVTTLFWGRLRAQLDEATLAEYAADVDHLKELAAGSGGFISIKTYAADDGERLTVVFFETMEDQRRWRADPEHRVIQQKGRDRYYDGYRLVVGETLREYEWERD